MNIVLPSQQDRNVFGRLLTITLASLERLAMDISHTKLGLQGIAKRAVVVDRIIANNYLIHIVEVWDGDGVWYSLEVRVPAWGWGRGITKEAIDALRSEVTTMRVLFETTPTATEGYTCGKVPWVWAWDPSVDNEIGAPYICTNRLKGVPVSQIWHRRDMLPGRLGQVRLNILRSLTAVLKEFRSKSYDSMGCLAESVMHSAPFMGPIYEWRENDDGSLRIVAMGPFPTVQSYLNAHPLDNFGRKDVVLDRAVSRLMEPVNSVLHAVLSPSEPTTFEMAPPDLDADSIHVDYDGNVIGLSNWSLARTLPAAVARMMYPDWLTSEWHVPTPSNIFVMEGLKDPAPMLTNLRRFYHQHLAADFGEGHPAWLCDRRAPILEAMWLARIDRQHRLDLCGAIVERFSRVDPDFSPQLLRMMGEEPDPDCCFLTSIQTFVYEMAFPGAGAEMFYNGAATFAFIV
ncbi:hypothetical protein N3K66_000851 [Trichothecium roseum]|uniref:Uncharacterized protein n=1 Tax=Trichothecium roseum TaxID=47278 RepID=A0ACC0VD58_9HYPO|nr:hypothetical protein N3K66_000851 [Trichothecium roseum]